MEPLRGIINKYLGSGMNIEQVREKFENLTIRPLVFKDFGNFILICSLI